MINLILISLPILFTDIVNPVLLAAVLFAMGSAKPFRNAWGILLGWLIIYFTSGILLALGFDSILKFLENPRPIDFYIQLVISALLIWFGIKLVRKSNPRKKETDYGKSSALTPGKSFLIGATVNIVGLPFAIPYFAILNQIMHSHLTWGPALLVLLVYNILYILPFSVLMLIRLIYKEQSEAMFEKIKEKMETIGNIIMPLIIFALAAVFIVDSVLYFVTGTPLINL